MTETKEKKPDVSQRRLKAAGYRYKLKELTAEEKKEQREGVKIEDPATGKIVTYDPPDYNYYYKVIGEVTVKIFKVGDRFYYKNTRFRYMNTLAAVERFAKDDFEYDKLQALVVDTEPIIDVPLSTDHVPPGCILITLKDGPLNNKKVIWKDRYPSHMAQFTDDDGKVKAARYSRDKEKRHIYNFLDVIG